MEVLFISHPEVQPVQFPDLTVFFPIRLKKLRILWTKAAKATIIIKYAI